MSSKSSYIDDSNENDVEPLVSTPSQRLRRSTRLRQSQNDNIIDVSSALFQKKQISLRSCLLALSLSTTLSVFWLLDSLKDPVFATLVQGNLKKHQPMAKIFSVVGNLLIVVVMEFISHQRMKTKLESLHAQNDELLDDSDVLDPGGHWTKMNIDSDTRVHGKRQVTNAMTRIPTSIFRIVGTAYLCALASAAYLLTYHPDLQKDSIVNVSADSALVVTDTSWFCLGYFLYLTIESFGSISVATFWSYANSTLTLRAAKTYYGFLIAIAQLGAVGGSSFATLETISIPTKIWAACAGIVLQMSIIQAYGHFYPHAMQDEEDDLIDTTMDRARRNCHQGNKEINEITLSSQRPRLFSSVHLERNNILSNTNVFVSGVILILKHNYLLLILGVSCLHEISLTCLDYEMKLIGLAKFSTDSEQNHDSGTTFTTFMGRYGQLTNILSFLLSFYIFPYLMKHYGIKYTLRLFPVLLLVVNILTYVAMPENLPVLFVSLSLLKAITYSINDPTHEILYIPTSDSVKFKAKFWIDAVGARIAKALGSVINKYAGTVDRIIQYGSLPSIVTALVLFVVCYAVGLEFDSIIEQGIIIGQEDEVSLYRSNAEV